MNVTRFLASKTAIAVPNKTNPKVWLAIDNAQLSRVSFNLYNPFSFKGKLFKKVVRFICVYSNGLSKIILATTTKTASPFVKHLENELGKKLTSSVYIGTAKDKVVLQLADSNTVVGYVKYPLTKQGEGRLQNEKKAIRILSKLTIIPDLLFEGTYEGIPFIILKELSGKIGNVHNTQLISVLKSFEKGNLHKLTDHPRLIFLKQKAVELGLVYLVNRINNLAIKSNVKYKEVYEHGDFAPWNLIQIAKGILPFDFEYFFKDGMEFFDEIKYHFQIVNLIEGKSGEQLIKTLSSRIDLDEFLVVMELFLVKEILIKVEENKPYNLETELIQYLDNAKA